MFSASLVLLLSFTASGLSPGNDLCVGAIPLTNNEQSLGTNLLATDDSSAVSQLCQFTGESGPNVWYYFYSGSATLADITLCDPITNFKTVLFLYTGSCGSLVCVTFNDIGFPCDVAPVSSRIIGISIDTYTTYYIMVSGRPFGNTLDKGNFKISLRLYANTESYCTSYTLPGVCLFPFGNSTTYAVPQPGVLPSGSNSLNLISSVASASTLQEGHIVMLIQMQGASISSANNDNYGDESSGSGYMSLGLAGNYEFLVIRAIDSSIFGTISLTFTTPTVKQYSQLTPGPENRFQVVRVPFCKIFQITNPIDVPPWNGEYGGVFAVFANILNMQSGGPISADGAGFRGGESYVAGGVLNSVDDYVTEQGSYARKGEGLAGSPMYSSIPYSYPVGDCAKGAPANAGGGGNCVQCGGGGGSNYGSGGKGGANLPDLGGLGGATVNISPELQIIMGTFNFYFTLELYSYLSAKVGVVELVEETLVHPKNLLVELEAELSICTLAVSLTLIIILLLQMDSVQLLPLHGEVEEVRNSVCFSKTMRLKQLLGGGGGSIYLLSPNPSTFNNIAFANARGGDGQLTLGSTPGGGGGSGGRIVSVTFSITSDVDGGNPGTSIGVAPLPGSPGTVIEIVDIDGFPSSAIYCVPSASRSNTKSISASKTSTISVSASTTPSKSYSISVSISRSSTASASVSKSPSKSISESRSPTKSRTASISESRSPTSTRSGSRSLSLSRSNSKTPSISLSDSATLSLTSAPSIPQSPSRTMTLTRTSTKTTTSSLSKSGSTTASKTPTRTASLSKSSSISKTQTSTITITRTPSASLSRSTRESPTSSTTNTPTSIPSISKSGSVTSTPTKSLSKSISGTTK